MTESRTTTKALSAVAIVLVLVVGTLAIVFFSGLFGPPNGPPVKGITGTYTVYSVVLGHRDATFLHWGLHASVRLDSTTILTQAPQTLPDGTSWEDNAKPITVTVTISGGSSAPINFNFVQQVSMGAQFARVFTVSLASGSWVINSTGVDSDGLRSSVVGGITLP